MHKEDMEWIVKLIGIFTDIKICLALFLVTSIFLVINYLEKIYLNHDWKLWLTSICLYTLFIIFIKVFMQIYSKINNAKDSDKCRINRLNIIFNEIDTSRRYYKNYPERLLLKLLYKYKLKNFAIHEFLPYIKDVHPGEIQNVLNKLCQNSYAFVNDNLLQIKDGKYNIYNCVWNELKKYNKSGVLSNENID